MFVCPHCKEKLNKIGVVSTSTQIYDGSDYSNLNIEETDYYFCPECGDKLPKGFDESSVEKK